MDARTYRTACILFHKVCTLPASDRETYLEKHCHGNAELLELVHDLLANDPEPPHRVIPLAGKRKKGPW